LNKSTKQNKNPSQKTVEDELQKLKGRTAELEAANQELEAFTSNVSHDLRSPLRTILAFSQLLRSEFGKQSPPRAQEYLETVIQTAEKMNLLIDDLLTFSRYSRQPLKKQKVDLAVLVREVLQELRIEQSGRRIETKIWELPLCYGDPSLLKQVLINLLSNALKFTREKEIVEIEVGCKQMDDEYVYFVRDNGIGFDMKNARNLFMGFHRLSSKYEGTGIGLALVQRIIQRHGGRVWFKSEIDKGATFHFTLGQTGK